MGIEFKGPDEIVGEAGGVFGVVAKDRKAVSVVSVKPVLRAKPEETHFVLDDAGDIAVGKAIPGAYAGKRDLGRLGIGYYGQKADREKGPQPGN